MLMFLQVERGTITKGSEIEIVGHGANFKTILTGVGMLSLLNI